MNEFVYKWILSSFCWYGLLILTFVGQSRVHAQQEVEGGNVTEADYYSSAYQGAGQYAPFGSRPGQATNRSSCHYIRQIPLNLRDPTHMKPLGLSLHYQKYTEAYGIPVISTQHVHDNALRRACYTLRFLLAGNSAVRQSFYSNFGRVAVIGIGENTTSIPEHSNLHSYWNVRARGLGATPHAPVSTGGEENLLCYNNDRYRTQDIFLHEAAHGVHLLGASFAIPGWDQRLRTLYAEAKARGLWANTYSMASAEEYFAEGTQSYFDVNSFSAVPDGINGPINNRTKLQKYDPELYNLIREVFPCDNLYMKRCFSHRFLEFTQPMKMDCNPGAGAGGERARPAGEAGGAASECSDRNRYCGYWTSQGHCKDRPDYMNIHCRVSCNLCVGGPCLDQSPHCGHWAANGYCQSNPGYMNNNCKESCELC